VKVLLKLNLSGLYPTVTASPQGGVESNGRGTDGPQETNTIRPDAPVSQLEDGETHTREEE
jgi:hypothetical protein